MNTTTAVRERPILFSGEMVRAILAGTKTQTRRICTVQPTSDHGISEKPTRWRGRDGRLWFLMTVECDWWFGRCPFGEPGDRLWVRETWAPLDHLTHNDPGAAALADGCFYRSDGRVLDDEITRWVPSIHMPRERSRLTLEITEVRIERLQDGGDREFWGEDRWAANPWVWAVSFRRVGA